MRLAPVLAVFAALAFPAPAGANSHRHHRPHHHLVRARVVRENPTQAALAIAYRYWGQAPCAGRVETVMAAPPANDENGGRYASMWVSWDRNTPQENNEAAPQPFSDCIIGINPHAWNTEALAAFTAWPEFSVELVHEVGHLLGHPHSLNPTAIMFPEPSAHVSVTGEYAPGWG